MNVIKFRIPATKYFFKWGKCETIKGVNFVVYTGVSQLLKQSDWAQIQDFK